MLAFSPSDWVLDQEASHCVLRICLIRCMLAIRVMSTLVMLSPTTSFIMLYYSNNSLWDQSLCILVTHMTNKNTTNLLHVVVGKQICLLNDCTATCTNLALPGAPGLKDGVGSKDPRVGAGYLDFITWEGCAWVGARWSLEPCAGGKGAKQWEGLLQGALSLKNWSLGQYAIQIYTSHTLVTPCWSSGSHGPL